MAKIIIKRGLQASVDNLVLSEGELAVALDTGNVYVGTTAGKNWINPPAGAAETAVKLASKREFKITGDGTSQPVQFDGSGNVDLVLALATMSGLTAGTYTKLTVDTKGRVTAATSITVADLPSIPSSKITGLGSAAALDAGNTAGKVVVVGADGRIDQNLLPDLAITDVFEAANQAAMLALNAQRGDICVRTDENKSYILSAAPASALSNWRLLRTPTDTVLSVNGKTGAVTLSAADVGAEPAVKNAAAKATPADGDGFVLLDSAAANATKKLTFTGLKAALKTYFDTLYNKYMHPAHTPRASGLYKVTVDAEGHVTGAVAVTKADITALGIPGQDTTYTLPTASATIKGGAKVGDGLTMAGDVLSVGDIDGGTF